LGAAHMAALRRRLSGDSGSYVRAGPGPTRKGAPEPEAGCQHRSPFLPPHLLRVEVVVHVPVQPPPVPHLPIPRRCAQVGLGLWRVHGKCTYW